jgi:hypothetical protein
MDGDMFPLYGTKLDDLTARSPVTKTLVSEMIVL